MHRDVCIQLPFVSFAIGIISNEMCKDTTSFLGATSKYFDLPIPFTYSRSWACIFWSSQLCLIGGIWFPNLDLF
jgi:hypothetical protein